MERKKPTIEELKAALGWCMLVLEDKELTEPEQAMFDKEILPMVATGRLILACRGIVDRKPNRSILREGSGFGSKSTCANLSDDFGAN